MNIPKRKNKAWKEQRLMIDRSFHMAQCDWPKGPWWPRVVWILRETDCSSCSCCDLCGVKYSLLTPFATWQPVLAHVYYIPLYTCGRYKSIHKTKTHILSCIRCCIAVRGGYNGCKLLIETLQEVLWLTSGRSWTSPLITMSIMRCHTRIQRGLLEGKNEAIRNHFSSVSGFSLGSLCLPWDPCIEPWRQYQFLAHLPSSLLVSIDWSHYNEYIILTGNSSWLQSLQFNKSLNCTVYLCVHVYHVYREKETDKY